MPTSSRYGWSTPAPTDPDDVPTDLASLASQIETTLATITADTGWVTSGVVSPSAGVSVGSCRFRRVGPWVSCDIFLTATVDYTFGPTGDISNSIFNARITDARFLPSGGSQALAVHGVSGRLLSAAVETSGRILIGALGGTSAIAVGDALRMGGTYLAG